MILLINYSHKWWYKALSVLLVVALILAFSFGVAPQAHAVGVLTITVCAAILAVMAGAGIATVVSGMTSADIQNWMTGKLNEWDLYRNDGNVFTDLIQNNLITTTVKGALAIGNVAARGISDFISWLKNDLSISDNDNIIIISNPSSVKLPLYVTDNYTQYIKVFGQSNYSRAFYFSSDSLNTYVVKVAGKYAFIDTSDFIMHQAYTTNGINPIYSSSYAGNYTYFDGNNYYHVIFSNSNNNISYLQVPEYNTLNEVFQDYSNMINSTGQSLSLDTDVINIPSVANDGLTDIVIGIDGLYPGATTDEATDVIMDGVLDNTLDTTMTVTDEYVDAVEAVVINEQPISVNTDHHMISFTGLPDFTQLHLSSIWHYVTDAVSYASGFISWFVSMLSAIPTLAIPLYMSFTLLVVLSILRRFV